jgi:hypothetical protein
MTPFYSSVLAKPKQAVYAGMNRSIMIMAGGTGGHIFAFGITPAVRASALSENVSGKDGFHV